MFQAPSKRMLFSLLTRKGKVPRLNLHPLRSMSWLRGRGSPQVLLPCPGNVRPALKFGSSCHCPVQLRRQLSAGGVQTLLSHHHRGLQLPLGILRLPKSGLRPMNCNAWRPLPPLGRRSRNEERGRPWFKTCAGQWAAGVRAWEVCRTQPSSCSWDPQLPSQTAWRALGRRLWSACQSTLSGRTTEDHRKTDG